ncbi:MAG TPA: amidase [Methylibium sp.]|uniref:amidase n=1 Tax=Methylibium sp. TaxID=2067992 RepID=UPI002DB8AF11|nr:amidase [Methylibium sp.]HEU4460080.1 amidase [Methylibium sp.]
MKVDEIHTYSSIADIAAAIREGEFTSLALVEHQLERIARFDRQLRAFVEVYADEALGAARALDQMTASGVRLGPLHGVTVAVKDLFEIEGRKLGAGSLAIPPRISATTATAVARLRAAGAVIIGKTQTVEYAFGGWGTNAVMGTPWNPWDLETHRVPGGSSSGSAVAVAAGFCTAALGTDTGGSVRIPAGLCGIVGLKTTGGLVSRHGVLELCPTHDTVGVLTRTVHDAGLMLDVIAGPDANDPVTLKAPTRSVLHHIEQGIEGLRVWVLPQGERSFAEPEVLRLYDGALETLRAMGARLVERELPQSCTESMRIAGSLMSAEGYANLGELFEKELEFDPHVRRRILLGRDIGAAQYIELQKLRDKAGRDMLDAMDGIDVCCFPTNAITAIPVAEVDELSTPLSRFGRFVNLLDMCSLAVPAGLSAPEGLPVSVQFIGRPLAEPLVLRAARAFEAATTWHEAVPRGLA